MNFIEILFKTLTTEKINTAIIASLGIILLGYYCRRKNIFGEKERLHWPQMLITVKSVFSQYNEGQVGSYRAAPLALRG